MRTLTYLLAALVLLTNSHFARAQPDRPNILLAIADDWGWPHAAAYGDVVVQTPTFDRIAEEGVRFDNAYISSPSCTPSRGALLTGQYHWRLGAGANLWSIFPDDHPSYHELLAEHGYQSGHAGKAWGPGRQANPDRQIAGPRFKSLDEFLAQRDPNKPFVFWLGSSDPHRPYTPGSGEASGMRLDSVHLFGHFPDDPVVRSDVADYYWEVERFDTLVGSALDSLQAAGLLDNTIVVMTGDHGMPFPRAKSNLYDCGTRVPLAIRYPPSIPPARAVSDLVSLTDLAPTFLEFAGLDPTPEMTGRSLRPTLEIKGEGRTSHDPGAVYFGKERHVPAQRAPDMGGYPSRAVRTHEYLYIRNYTPDRWPAGSPDYEHTNFPGSWYADCDPGPTKDFIILHADESPELRRAYELCFAKRPAEELYDCLADPDQLVNLAADPAHADTKARLAAMLDAELLRTEDPRARGRGEEVFDGHPYLGGGGGKHPDLKPNR